MRPASFVAPPVPTDGVVYGEAMLWAGDLVATEKPTRLSTVLGSCVAVCLYDARQRFGGMNHFLVPRGNATSHHGDWATERLVQRMQQLGSRTTDLQAKLFGGGSPLRLENDALAVGAENVNVAREVIGRFRIPILVERVGHPAGIRLFFENWTGTVWLRAHQDASAARLQSAGTSRAPARAM